VYTSKKKFSAVFDKYKASAPWQKERERRSKARKKQKESN
jgi:hypothetical protein